MTNTINKNIDYFISYREAVKFCSECFEICSRRCEIWRKAEKNYDVSVKGEKRDGRKA